MVLRYPQTRPSLGGLDQTKTKSDQTIPITASGYSVCKGDNTGKNQAEVAWRTLWNVVILCFVLLYADI